MSNFDFEFVHPTLETVLECQEENPTSLIERDGRTYIDIELVVSLVDQTLQENLDRAQREKCSEMVSHLAFLATTMRFMPELMMYKSLQRELDEGLPPGP